MGSEMCIRDRQTLVTTNTVPHSSNEIDVSELLVPPVRHFLNQVEGERR